MKSAKSPFYSVKTVSNGMICCLTAFAGKCGEQGESTQIFKLLNTSKWNFFIISLKKCCKARKCNQVCYLEHFCMFFAANWLSFDKFICLYFVFSQLHYMYSAEDFEQRNLQ